MSSYGIHELNCSYHKPNLITMDAALEKLRELGDKEFLFLTRTALRIIQNILSEPEQEKYRRVRSASKVSEHCRDKDVYIVISN